MASGYSDLSEIRKNQVYAQYNRPAKINLLNERPRRESQVEQQLATNLTRPEIYTNNEKSDFGERNLQNPATSPSGPLDSVLNHLDAITSLGTYTQTSQATSSHLPFQTQIGGRRDDSVFEVTNQFTELERGLAQKEARLKREIAHMNQQLSPWARPRQIREPRREPEPRCSRGQQRWVKECPSPSPSPRPTSRASSTKSNLEADLLDKAYKLTQTAEELEKKPLKTQMVLIESGARRTVDPPMTPSVSSIHTAIIKVPSHEIDNKSPLPVAFDNFSTLGVRGNLASLGGAPPESPYPPIFPVVKRTPSPYRGNDRGDY